LYQFLGVNMSIQDDIGFSLTPVQVDLPLVDVHLISGDEIAFNDPTESFWVDKKQEFGSNVVVGRILRTDKDSGSMRVLGITEDINVDVPIPSSGCVTGDLNGDVSQPAAGAQVVMLKDGNGDYYPVSFMRPFSEEYGYNFNVPDEIEEGDLGWVTRGGSRFFLFESGLVQIESAPNCIRLMTSIEEGEKIQDLCREYSLFTDTGKIQMKRRNDLVDFVSLIVEAGDSSSADPSPVARIEMGALNDIGTKQGVELKAIASSINGVETDGPSITLDKTGVSEFKAGVSTTIEAPNTTIDANRIALGGSDATEPGVLGLQLLARLKALETAFGLHVHVVAGAAAKPVDPPFVATGDFLSKVNFLK
jgi:hypothetical protein